MNALAAGMTGSIQYRSSTPREKLFFVYRDGGVIPARVYRDMDAAMDFLRLQISEGGEEHMRWHIQEIEVS